MKHHPLLFLFLSLFLSKGIKAQDTAKSPYKPEYNVLPVVYYLPETGLGFGAAGVVSFRFRNQEPFGKPSQLQLAASYTLQNQILLYLPYRLFWNKDKYLTYGELGFYKYTYNYYGIGPEAPAEDEESYDLIYPRIRSSFLYEFFPSTYIGARYWYDNFNITDVKEDGLLDTANTVGKRGGAAGGLGAVINYDSRDNQFYASKGWFVEGVVLPNTKAFGSEFEFLKISIDATKYFNFYKEHILAVNTYAESNIGEVPFYQLAFAGGNKRLRGYYEGRFRDHNAVILQAEYRWMFYKRFGLTLFYGLGNVAPSPVDFQLALTKQTFGGGLRFRLSKREKLNIRLDYGISADGASNFYFTFGEAF